MSTNGNRPGEGAAISVGKASNAAERTSQAHRTQAIAGRAPVEWLQAVSRDRRIGVLHRFALIGIGLHRRSSFDAVASAIGLDHVSVLRAADIAGRYGWLLTEPDGRVLFTFPPPRNLQDRPLPAPSPLPRRAL